MYETSLWFNFHSFPGVTLGYRESKRFVQGQEKLESWLWNLMFRTCSLALVSIVFSSSPYCFWVPPSHPHPASSFPIPLQCWTRPSPWHPAPPNYSFHSTPALTASTLLFSIRDGRWRQGAEFFSDLDKIVFWGGISLNKVWGLQDQMTHQILSSRWASARKLSLSQSLTGLFLNQAMLLKTCI